MDQKEDLSVEDRPPACQQVQERGPSEQVWTGPEGEGWDHLTCDWPMASWLVDTKDPLNREADTTQNISFKQVTDLIICIDTIQRQTHVSYFSIKSSFWWAVSRVKCVVLMVRLYESISRSETNKHKLITMYLGIYSKKTLTGDQ